MSVKIRLTRMGRKKRPFYRVVVMDSRKPRDGRYIECVGTYNPIVDPAEIKIEEDRIEYWLGTGAQTSDTVRNLLKKQGFLYKQNLKKQGLDEAKIDEEMKKWEVLQIEKRRRQEAEIAQKKKAKAEATEPPVEEKAPETPAEEPVEEVKAEAAPAPEEKPEESSKEEPKEAPAVEETADAAEAGAAPEEKVEEEVKATDEKAPESTDSAEEEKLEQDENKEEKEEA